MKSLVNYIQEKLIIKKNKGSNNYKYFPETKEELREIIDKRIKQEGNEVDLNDIDVSQITDISYLFEYTNFNGNISTWDVSNVTDMKWVFFGCTKFNQDISAWDVSNVINMKGMFLGCETFNQDISSWEVSNVTNMEQMFYRCKAFNQNISGWEVSNVTDMKDMFYNCPIEEKYKPKFK